MDFKRNVVLLWGFLFVMNWALAAHGAPKVGVLTEVRGTVEILHEGEASFKAAKQYGEVFEKDKIRTGPDGRAKILYDDDSMTILAENSAIEVRQYELTQEKKRTQSVIALLKGKLRFIVTKHLSKDRPNFSVQTPTAVLGVRGSDSVAILEGDTTKAYHLFGDLEITNSITGEKLVIKSGQWAIIFPDGRMISGTIGPEELKEILGFFSRLSPEEQRRYADEIQKELQQEGIEVILPLPDREPGSFERPPKPPKEEQPPGYETTPGGGGKR
jgi:hypothetical protein